MAAFNFKKFVVDTVRQITIELPKQMVKQVGYQAKNTIKSTAHNTLNAVTAIPKTVEDKITNLDDVIAGIPVAPGLDVAQLVTALSNPLENKDDFSKSVEAFTGVNINSLSPTQLTDRAIAARLEEFSISLRQQIMFEIQECINRYIRGLVNKNLDIFQILNFEDYLANQIAKLRLKLKNKIQRQIEKLFYDKLKIQQVALLKQKILQSIRKICPSSGQLSPSLTKRLQEDRSWEIAEPDRTIKESGTNTNLELLANSQKDGSTGQDIIDITDESMESVVPVAKAQVSGYDGNSIDDFVTPSGELVV